MHQETSYLNWDTPIINASVMRLISQSLQSKTLSEQLDQPPI